MSIGVNCAIIYFTSDTLPEIVNYKYTDLQQFMLIVMIEHIIIGLKLLIAVLITDKPEWVTKEEHENELQLDEVFASL